MPSPRTADAFRYHTIYLCPRPSSSYKCASRPVSPLTTSHNAAFPVHTSHSPLRPHLTDNGPCFHRHNLTLHHCLYTSCLPCASLVTLLPSSIRTCSGWQPKHHSSTPSPARPITHLPKTPTRMPAGLRTTRRARIPTMTLTTPTTSTSLRGSGSPTANTSTTRSSCRMACK